MKELFRTTIKKMAANKLINHVKKEKVVCSLLMSVSETVLLHCGNGASFHTIIRQLRWLPGLREEACRL